MRFNKEFFYKEVRDGFLVSSLMKRCWAAQLEVMEQFDILCKKYNIRYFLAYGTLLGAVRHKGFIPWDDDIDIWIPRIDLDRLIREASNDITNAGLELISPFSLEDYDSLVFRVINTRDICLEESFLMKYWLFPFMAGLDLFPLDNVPDDAQEMETQKTLMISADYLARNWDNGKIEDEEKWDTYKELLVLTGQNETSQDMIVNELWKLSDRVCAMYETEKTERIAALPYMYHDPGKVFLGKWCERTVFLEFEGLSLPCPADYHEVLKVEFGDDYMCPKQIKGTHDYPYYKNKHKQLLEWFDNNGIKCPEMYKEL